MATKIAQFRYYSDNNINNYPKNWSWAIYCEAQAFKAYSPIMQLGIQTLPGTRLYINSSTTPVIVGSTGIFELDVTNTSASIASIRIEQASMQKLRELDNGYLIIDIVYEEGS